MAMSFRGRRAVVDGVNGLVGTAEAARLGEVALELRRQAADLPAAEYRWLVLLEEFEEFDRGGGWGLEGARSCGVARMGMRDGHGAQRGAPRQLCRTCDSLAA